MTIKDDQDQPAEISHLFMLRMWREDLGSGQGDWRGKIQHVNSGEARYFRDWPILEAFVENLVGSTEQAGSHPDSAQEIGGIHEER
jgi:hypothetical protein